MYEVKGKTTEISATSRVALKVKDNFYTVEASEKRTVPTENVDMKAEWEDLWNSVNGIVDNQANEIYTMFAKK